MPTSASNLRRDSDTLRDRIKDFEGVADKEYDNKPRWYRVAAWFGSIITFNLFGPKRSEHAPHYIRLINEDLGRLDRYLKELAELRENGSDSTLEGCPVTLRRVEEATSLFDKRFIAFLTGIHSSRNPRDYEAYHKALDSLLTNLRSTTENMNEYLTDISLPKVLIVDRKLHAERRADPICLERLCRVQAELSQVTERLNSLKNFGSAERASSQEDFRDPATSVASELSDSGRAPQRPQVSSDRPCQPAAAQPTRQSSAAQQQRPDQPRPATQRPSNKQSSGCCACFSSFFSAVIRNVLGPCTPSRAQPARPQRVDTAFGYPDLPPRRNRIG